jgi:prefoldin alpha subunit
MKKEEVMEKYTELQLLDQQINQMQQQLNLLENKLIQLNTLSENLEDIGKTKKDSEILAPLGAGIFVKSSIKDSKNILMNVGSNVVIEKDIPTSKRLVKDQITEVENLLSSLTHEVSQFHLRAQDLRKELQSRLEK